MSTSRSQSTLYVLVAIGAFFALVIPARISDPVRDVVRFGYYPISWPGNRLIDAVFGKAEHPQDARSDDAIVFENDQLKVQVASLRGQLSRLEEVEAQREMIGNVRALCRPSRVVGIGADAAQRQTLLIAAGSHEGVADRMPVLYGGIAGGGIAGRIAPGRVQITGSLVQLITDRGFRVGVKFARFTPRADGGVDYAPINTSQVLAEGDGAGAMWIKNLPMRDAQAAGLKKDDWVILADDDWPDALQHYRLGRIESIDPRASAAGFAEIRVAAPTKLMNLREVLVMMK